jgi:hypothetical protein
MIDAYLLRSASLLGCAFSLAAAGVASAATPEAPAPSPFIQCDGSKGHVGALGLIGQLVAITATAGLASDAFTKDDGNLEKRQSGKVGAAACDAAIAQESNPTRRTQLGLARAIHLIEAQDLPAALEKIREVPGLAPDMANDWAFQGSLGASTRYIEATILAQMGRAEEAEDTAMRSAELAPNDMYALFRVAHFAQLTPRSTPLKRGFLERISRLYPQHLGLRAEQMGWWGDYAGAAEDKRDQRVGWLAFARSTEVNVSNLLAEESLFLLMAGKTAEADAVAADARKMLDAFIAKGAANTSGIVVSEAEASLAFYNVAKPAMLGDPDTARTAFAARERWLNVTPPVVADVYKRLYDGLPAEKRTGRFGQAPAQLRQVTFDGNVQVLKQAGMVDTLYLRTTPVAKIGDYQRLSSSVWKIGDKPKFLVRKLPKSLEGFEMIDTSLVASGLPAGEALLLHAALIAKSRGKDGFLLTPTRKYLYGSLVKFGNAGEAGFPAGSTFSADKVIAELSLHIPEPLPR